MERSAIRDYRFNDQRSRISLRSIQATHFSNHATMIRLRNCVREERPSWRSSLASERRASGA
jgi:hypothetical protein